MWPCWAVKPASGRKTSLGSGGNRFSRAMARPAPGAPTASIRPTTQPVTPLGSLTSTTIRTKVRFVRLLSVRPARRGVRRAGVAHSGFDQAADNPVLPRVWSSAPA